MLLAEYTVGFKKSANLRGQWTIDIGLPGETPKSKVKPEAVSSMVGG
jgi:hypothetical protein